MSVITKVLRQTCVYWPPASPDRYGQPTQGNPVELNCRWDDMIQEVVKDDGTIVMSKAEVMVSADVEVGGVLFLGTMDDVVDITNPKGNEGAYEILKFAKNPNFKCTEFVRTAYL